MKISNLNTVVSFVLITFFLNIDSSLAQEVSKDNITGVWYKTHNDEPVFITKKSNDTLRVMFLSSRYIDLPKDTVNPTSYRYTKINPNAISPRARVSRYVITPRGKDTLQLQMQDVVYFAQRKNCKN